ncbi:MAG: hypothetical protein COA66_06100 [Arcobacter sp.]|nr:MAG: hypothetical protein COA66_06100 [Arcobacter sp.]
MIKKILITISLSASLLIAQSELTGSIGLGLGNSDIENNFFVHDDNDKINSINTEGNSIDKNFVSPLLNLNYGNFSLYASAEKQRLSYSWKKNNAVYIKLNGLGIEQEFDNKIFYALDYSVEDMYTNPYAINVDRKTDSAKIINFNLGINELYDFLTIEYMHEKLKIDDKVNKTEEQSYYKNEINVMGKVMDFNENSDAHLGFIVGNGVYDGESNDYNKIGLKYEMEVNFLNTHQVKIENSYEIYNFDEKNSYFNKERDEKVFAFKLIYNKTNFLNYKNVFLNTVLIKNTKNSNIDFFKSNQELFLVSIGYRF